MRVLRCVQCAFAHPRLSTLLSVFYVSYIIFEIPLTVLCKRVGPGRFLPAACFAFGLLSMCVGLRSPLSSCD